VRSVESRVSLPVANKQRQTPQTAEQLVVLRLAPISNRSSTTHIHPLDASTAFGFRETSGTRRPALNRPLGSSATTSTATRQIARPPSTGARHVAATSRHRSNPPTASLHQDRNLRSGAHPGELLYLNRDRSDKSFTRPARPRDVSQPCPAPSAPSPGAYSSFASNRHLHRHHRSDVPIAPDASDRLRVESRALAGGAQTPALRVSRRVAPPQQLSYAVGYSTISSARAGNRTVYAANFRRITNIPLISVWAAAAQCFSVSADL